MTGFPILSVATFLPLRLDDEDDFEEDADSEADSDSESDDWDDEEE